MLDPHRLRIFRSVVASGSIQAAARHLGYTPSAVSQHVAALQREVGFPLIERSGRGIVPTPAGVTLARESDDVITSLNRLDSVVADLRDQRTGRVTIGYFSSAGKAWMPRVARALMDQFPTLVIELMLNEVMDDPEKLKLDLDLFVDGPHVNRSTPDGYRRRFLADDPYVLVVPETHRLSDRASVPLGELVDETWINCDAAGALSHRLLMKACDAAGFTPRFAVQAEDHYTGIAFAAQGVGVTVVPRLAAHDMPPTTRTVRLTDPEPVRRISLLVRESIMGTPEALTAQRLFAEHTAGLREDPAALAYAAQLRRAEQRSE
jgi:DNA-binding transcriptional LysR family regulator